MLSFFPELIWTVCTEDYASELLWSIFVCLNFHSKLWSWQTDWTVYLPSRVNNCSFVMHDPLLLHFLEFDCVGYNVNYMWMYPSVSLQLMWWSYLLCRCGGTVGAILTCPLEVVKTRLQSSSVTLYVSEVHLNTVNGATVNRVTRVSPGPLHCLKWVYLLLGFGYIGEWGVKRCVGQISMEDSDSCIYRDATEMTFLYLLFNCN